MMADTINGRTPEEIKKGLECCSLPYKCDKCPYFGMPCGSDDLSADALALIKQLERERDAALEDMKTKSFGCGKCKHFMPSPGKMCALPIEERIPFYECWEWRGVQEVE